MFMASAENVVESKTVAEHSVVAGLGEGLAVQLEPRCVATGAIARIDEGAHLIHGHPVLDQVGELAGGVAGVIGKSL